MVPDTGSCCVFEPAAHIRQRPDHENPKSRQTNTNACFSRKRALAPTKWVAVREYSKSRKVPVTHVAGRGPCMSGVWGWVRWNSWQTRLCFLFSKEERGASSLICMEERAPNPLTTSLSQPVLLILQSEDYLFHLLCCSTSHRHLSICCR